MHFMNIYYYLLFIISILKELHRLDPFMSVAMQPLYINKTEGYLFLLKLIKQPSAIICLSSFVISPI